jgi:hypothetical protein
VRGESRWRAAFGDVVWRLCRGACCRRNQRNTALCTATMRWFTDRLRFTVPSSAAFAAFPVPVRRQPHGGTHFSWLLSALLWAFTLLSPSFASRVTFSR